MAAFAIEELGNYEYKVVRFPYRWQARHWIAKKPETRRLATYSPLDVHLKEKAKRCAGPVILTDTRRERN